MNWAAIALWFGLMILFLIVESNTVALMSLWFAIGSLAALIAAALGAKLWLQVTVFLVVSVALLACLRPFLRKYIRPKITKTNVDAIVGSQGYVTTHIDNIEAKGQVKLSGMEWTARSSTGAPIAPGTLVKVDKIEGVKAFVSPVETQMKKEEVSL